MATPCWPYAILEHCHGLQPFLASLLNDLYTPGAEHVVPHVVVNEAKDLSRRAQRMFISSRLVQD